jgi:1-acyl-sn-glycerol-3-phosphate acyltransferase
MSDPPPPSASTDRAIIDQVVAFAGDRPAADLAKLRVNLEALLQEHGKAAVQHLIERLMTTGDRFAYYPPDILAKRIHYAVAEITMTPESEIVNADRLEAIRTEPVVFLANHLSYSDANLFEILLARAGFAEISNRLTVIAGPKVYSDPMRRFSSLCFGTIKTPQSSALSSDEAVMPVREVARLARETIDIARDRQKKGDALLVFVEGTRSRSASMARTLPAVARYLDEFDGFLVPVGIIGSERFVPVDEERIHPTKVQIRIGKPVAAKTLDDRCEGNRRLTMDAVGVAIGRLLPAEYTGVYADDPVTSPEFDLTDARAVVDDVFERAAAQ